MSIILLALQVVANSVAPPASLTNAPLPLPRWLQARSIDHTFECKLSPNVLGNGTIRGSVKVVNRSERTAEANIDFWTDSKKIIWLKGSGGGFVDVRDPSYQPFTVLAIDQPTRGYRVEFLFARGIVGKSGNFGRVAILHENVGVPNDLLTTAICSTRPRIEKS